MPEDNYGELDFGDDAEDQELARQIGGATRESKKTDYAPTEWVFTLLKLFEYINKYNT